MRSTSFAVLAVLAFAACGDNIAPAIDARPIDSPRIDAAVDGPCATGRQITGELVDLDSTSATFAGVHGAVFTQRAGTATDTTAPNGRFDMCVASTTTYLFDVDTPAHVDAIAYFEVDALQPPARPISFRTWTLASAAQLYTSFGLTYDATKAHVFVFAGGDRSALTLSGGSHGTVLSASDDPTPGTFTWYGGPTGRYTLFPNVDPTATEVMVIGDLSGPHTVPVAAGKITLVAASWFFLP